jgi:DmsE family decaheme c-type cytochrome
MNYALYRVAPVTRSTMQIYQKINLRKLNPVLQALALLVLMPLSFGASAKDVEAEQNTFSRKGADQCLMCHTDDHIMTVLKTPHGNTTDSRTPFAEGQAQCEACHGPGGKHTGRVKRGEERPPMIKFGSEKPTPVPEQNAMCLGCHQGHLGPNWQASPHNSQDIACADCHQLHVNRDPMTVPEDQPERCYACHSAQRAASFKPSSHPLRFGAMSCSQCHNPHGSVADSLLVKENTNQLCYGCHAEKRGPFLWEHAPVAEDCTNCHEPHGSVHPGMLKKRPPQLCQQCHSQAGHPSSAFTQAGVSQGTTSSMVLAGSCMNCHTEVHGSNHPSGRALMR